MKSNYRSTGAVSRRLTVMENFVSQPRKQRLFYSLEILVSFRMEARLGGGWMSQDRWKIVEECGVRRVLQVKERRGEGQVCPGGRYVLSGRGCRLLSASCVGAFRPWEVISAYENSYFHRSRATCGIIQFFNSFFVFDNLMDFQGLRFNLPFLGYKQNRTAFHCFIYFLGMVLS